ncbi:hypothetical protein [Methylobacterium sp. Leaf466]|uniref:hypothetical protein n=1 Tax=Methylobacterium sp. Leaf466 TaxID=1736386 RepID=UPI0006FD1EC2|nr:hypothetical protein [Methylobacterium sp. Leaf466]KQT82424.1 hypothetical protein ASG59_18705 [Methylobacterium sp. Leaf466]
MRDDIDQARRAGYSDDQILSIMAESDPGMRGEIEGAVKGGYSPTQVLTVLQDRQGEITRDGMKNQSWGDYAADLGKGVIYGAGAEAKAVGTTLSQPADATGRSSIINDAGSALQGAGDLATGMAGPGYKPAAFDLAHPIDTAGQLPKAAAEALPGIGATMLAGAGAGAVGGAIAGPVGAAVGSVGGAALYAFTRYWGSNAQAHAQEQGRAKPTQADFDATAAASVVQSGVDAATLKASGILGKTPGAEGLGRALAGPSPVKGAGVQGVVNSVGRGAQNSAIMGLGGGVNDAIGQVAATQDNAGGPSIDPMQSVNAAATGVGVGGIIAGARLPASVAGSIKYRSPNQAHTDAIGRVVDHMRSDAFPGDPSNKAETATNLKLMKGTTQDRINALNASEDAPLSPEQTTMLTEYGRYLKEGGKLTDKHIDTLDRAFEARPDVVDTLMDRSAVNWMSDKSGAEGGGVIAKTMAAMMRAPGRSGAALGAMSEIAPIVMGGLSAASIATGGATAITAALTAKTLAKLSGVKDVYGDPMRMITERYGSTQGNPLGSGMPQMPQGGLPTDQSGIAPGLPPRPPGAAPMAPQGPSAPVHSPLADIIGPPADPRFSPRGPTPEMPQAPQRGPMPFDEGGPGPRRPAPAEVAAPIDWMSEMRAQADAERQPLLDVMHQHHRSLRSVASNPRIDQGTRDRADAQAKETWGLVQGQEAISTPEQIKRARSPRTIDASPASPEIMAPTDLSQAGKAIMQAEGPAFFQALQSAGSTGGVRRAADAFVERFSGNDRRIVAAEIAKAQTKASAPSKAKSLKTRAKVKTKLAKTSRTGRPKKPRTVK